MTVAPEPGVKTPTIVVAVDEPEVVVSAAQRQRAGLAHWIDGTFGVLRSGPTTLMCSPNGPMTAIHRSIGTDAVGTPALNTRFFTDGLIDAALGFDEPPVRHNLAAGLAGFDSVTKRSTAVDHAAGGPLIELPGCPFPVLTYHAERFHDGDPRRFHAQLGWAEVRTSSDGSVRLADLGAIVDPPNDAAHPDRIVDVGSGPTILWRGDVWVFYPVRSDVDARCALGAARASIPQAVEAVRAGTTPTFATLPAPSGRNTETRDQSGSGPAVGSMPPDLLPNTRPWIAWLDVAVLSSIDQLVMVHSGPQRTNEGHTEWNLWLRTSADGSSWSAAVPLLASATTDELLYVTIDSGDQTQRLIRGSMFTIYYTRSSCADRWNDALIERIAVTWRPMGNTTQ